MALKKLKKGLKKVAKAVVPVGAALLAARALKKRNARNAMMNSATSNDGFAAPIGELQDNSFLPDDGFITRNNPYELWKTRVKRWRIKHQLNSLY